MPQKNRSSPLARKEDLDIILDDGAMESTFIALQDRSNAVYGGVLGALYESWPPHFHIEFEVTRNQLLRKLSHSDILLI